MGNDGTGVLKLDGALATMDDFVAGKLGWRCPASHKRRKGENAMRIDFDKIETTVIPHMRGGEKEVSASIYQDPVMKIMRGKLIPGATIGLHTHESN